MGSSGCTKVQAGDMGAFSFQCSVSQVWGREKQLALGTERFQLLNNCGDYKWLE